MTEKATVTGDEAAFAEEEKSVTEATIAEEDAGTAAEEAVETEEAEAAREAEPEASAEAKSEDADIDASAGAGEEKAATMAETDESKKSAAGGVSETIRKMTQSPAELPGESASPTTAEKTALSSVGTYLAVCAEDIMQKDVLWGSPDDSVEQTLTKMQEADVGYMMIGRDGVPEGIVAKSDLTGAVSPYLRPVFAKWRRPLDDATLQIKIKWIMSRPVRTIKPDTSLPEIMTNMRQFGGQCLPVVDQHGKVQGLVTVFDIFQALLKNNHNISTIGKTPQAPPLA